VSAEAPTERHFVEWTVTDDDATARFFCTAPTGATCRCWCASGCEEYCTAQPERTPQPDGTVILIGHPWTDTGSCRIADWLVYGSDDPADLFFGDDAADQALVRPGVHPIETEWDGDQYLWAYAVDEPAEASR
jgi:hypothetical protein